MESHPHPSPDDIPIESYSRAGNTVPVGEIEPVDEVLHRA